MLEGCDHCGTVVKRAGKDGGGCPGCGRAMRRIDASEARDLMRERRIADQFRRVSRLTRTMDARRALHPQ